MSPDRIRSAWASARNQTTDYRRWTNPRSIDLHWESRTRRAADFVPPNSRVIEFGAATRLLERHLDPSCTYVPSDIVERGPGTVVCDLNERPLPDIGAFDVAVVMGVLEYAKDVPAVLDWLTGHAPRVVISYASFDTRPRSLRGRLESIGRLRSGWMNSYSTDEFRSLFLDRGYRCLHEEKWEKQTLFVLSRVSDR